MLFSALVFGLLGSFHCIGMCGPIAFLLPLDRDNSFKRLFQIFLYHFGRIFSYALIGLVFGLLGKSLALFGLQQQLSIITGVIMLLLVIIPKKKLGKFNPEYSGFKVVSKLKNYLGRELRKKKPDTYFAVGFLNGFLPCGLVYMAVLGAIAAGSSLEGSLYMVLFGLGTIPLMTAAIWISNIISEKVRKYVRRLIPVFVAVVAILFILRGMGLGISYVSPDLEPEKISAGQSCH